MAGDTSDNIPGVSGVGEKTAINLIKEYKTIDGVYENIDNIKGKLKEKLEQDKDKAFLSRTLGTIDLEAPIEKNLEKIEVEEWDKEAVLEKFKKLKFNRFIDRFNLNNVVTKEKEITIKIDYEQIDNTDKINKLIKEIKENKKIFYYLVTKNTDDNKIINKQILGITIYSEADKKSYFIRNIKQFKEIFENIEILKIGYKLKEDYILLKQEKINPKNLMFDIEIAGYILNSNISKYSIEYLSNEYLRI